MPIDYSKGKIYKIVDNTTDNIYVGSTCQDTLAMRLAGHVRTYKSYLAGVTNRYVSSIEIIKNNNYNIVLLENYPCNNKDELLARERYYIELLNSINKIKVPKYIDTEEKRNVKNEGNLKSYYKYHTNNLTRRKQPIICECGREIRPDHKARHLKTNIHKINLSEVIISSL
jgi:hypothetical protein